MVFGLFVLSCGGSEEAEETTGDSTEEVADGSTCEKNCDKPCCSGDKKCDKGNKTCDKGDKCCNKGDKTCNKGDKTCNKKCDKNKNSGAVEDGVEKIETAIEDGVDAISTTIGNAK